MAVKHAHEDVALIINPRHSREEAGGTGWEITGTEER